MTFMQKGFIDRSPLWFLAGVFMLVAGILAKCIPLITLAIYDMSVGFAFFFHPNLDDNKPAKLFIYITYGALILWWVFWIMAKIS